MNDLSKKEILDILNSPSSVTKVFTFADKTRKQYVGDEVHLRGLIEFSNICKQKCKYCGIRCENKNIDRYRISPEDIILAAKSAAEKGFKTIVLQSGEDDFFSRDKMCYIIEQIKTFGPALTLSIGERSYEDYKAFKTAGADRYLIRIETTDQELYTKMHPNMDFKNRIKCLENLKTLGYEVGTGSLVGLPGQTLNSLADDILFFKAIDADMIGIGPLIPHPGTPLKDSAPGDFELSLKVMALVRILLKDINIPATTAMETLHPNGRIIALQSGANVVMPNTTSTDFQSKYEIYPGKPNQGTDFDKNLQEIKSKIISIGRTISETYGFRK